MDSVLLVIGVILAAVLVVVVVGAVASRAALASRLARARGALPPLAAGDAEDRALCVTAPFQGLGYMRLTNNALLFGRVAGDVLTIPRSVVVVCFASDDVPTGAGMRTLRRPALVVQINDPTLPQGMGFVIDDPAAWVQRMNGPPEG